MLGLPLIKLFRIVFCPRGELVRMLDRPLHKSVWILNNPLAKRERFAGLILRVRFCGLLQYYHATDICSVFMLRLTSILVRVTGTHCFCMIWIQSSCWRKLELLPNSK
jgi:hypothetical protein